MNRLTWMLLVIVSLTSLASCNTIQGVGRDIEKGGQANERAAK